MSRQQRKEPAQVWISFPGSTREEPPEALNHEVYDEAGERVIEDLPPGLYWEIRRISHVVRIDHEGRARQYPFERDGSRSGWEPYRGPGTDLRRADQERRAHEYLGWPVPKSTVFGYDEALSFTAWAGRNIERHCGLTLLTSYLPFWQYRAVELILRDAPVSDEARRLAGEVLGRVRAPRRLVELLAGECLERGEQEMLLATAQDAEGALTERAWLELVLGIFVARREHRRRAVGRGA